MADVNEELVKTYFEQKGFLVLSNKLYVIKKEKGKGYGDIDLMIYNPTTDERGIVQVKGWHTTTFTKSVLENKKDEIFNSLIGEGVINCARQFFGTGNFKKILVLSFFSKKEGLEKEAREYIKSMGIDEIITFAEVFKFIINRIEPNIHYKDSEVMFLIGKLKLYGFFNKT